MTTVVVAAEGAHTSPTTLGWHQHLPLFCRHPYEEACDADDIHYCPDGDDLLLRALDTEALGPLTPSFAACFGLKYHACTPSGIIKVESCCQEQSRSRSSI